MLRDREVFFGETVEVVRKEGVLHGDLEGLALTLYRGVTQVVGGLFGVGGGRGAGGDRSFGTAWTTAPHVLAETAQHEGLVHDAEPPVQVGAVQAAYTLGADSGHHRGGGVQGSHAYGP